MGKSIGIYDKVRIKKGTGYVRYLTKGGIVDRDVEGCVFGVDDEYAKVEIYEEFLRENESRYYKFRIKDISRVFGNNN